jgi:TPR repeat protein
VAQKKLLNRAMLKRKCTLGLMYGAGKGVIRDQQKACVLLRAAVEQGDRKAIEVYNEHCAD